MRKYEIYLPLKYNDGKAIESEKIVEVWDELAEAFGGITVIKLQLPYPVEEVHQILTDDPLGIESYWHKRFGSKRTNGEWFLLTDEDIALFKSRTQM